MKVDLSAPVYLVKGDDDVLRRDAVVDLVDALVGDEDRSLAVEELDHRSYTTDDGYEIAVVVDAAQTPPLFTARRVVVAREAGVFSNKDSVAPLVAYLTDPLPSTALILVWERAPTPGAHLGQVPRSLTDALRSAGGVVLDTKPGRSKSDRSDWISEQVAASGVKLDRPAMTLLEDHVGEDLELVRAVLKTLVATYGKGTKIGVDELQPYLGGAGQVAPWELTDAIDKGDVPGALSQLARMTGPGERHPLQVLATLHSHYSAMLALDGSGVHDERSAAEVLGLRGGSTFRAKKALAQSRRLGTHRLKEFIKLLARADLDLKGARGWPPDLVMEVLVARLAGRSRK